MSNFEKAVRSWLKKNNIDCNICFEDDFGYQIDNNTIHIGIMEYENVSHWYEQLLYEYGLDYVGILAPVLAFTHEIGHYMTINNFTKEELLICHLTKQFMNSEDEHDWFNKYWEVPDEFAANIWAINFINNNIEAVEELCNIYVNYWEEFVNVA